MKNKQVAQHYNWPHSHYNKMPLQNLVKQTQFTIKPLNLPPEIVEYIVLVCDQLKISIATLQIALSLGSRYLRIKPNNLPLQLIMMSSLIISCKFMQINPPQLSTFHKLSCNSFTNRDFYRTQMLILNETNFNIIAEGIPNRQISLVVRCVKALLKPEYEQIFPSIAADLEQILWVYLYSGRIKLREKEERAITATIVHLSFVFLTQFSGRFLQTVWACQMTDADQNDVNLLGNRFLKQILGEEKSKSYKL